MLALPADEHRGLVRLATFSCTLGERVFRSTLTGDVRRRTKRAASGPLQHLLHQGVHHLALGADGVVVLLHPLAGTHQLDPAALE